MFRYSVAAILSMLLIAFPAAAETRIGVVDLRQALFSSSDARAFSAVSYTHLTLPTVLRV